MRSIVAISAAVAVGAIALLAAGFADAERLAPVLAVRAPDGAVSGAYIAAFQTRARMCGVLLMVIATILPFLPRPVPAPPKPRIPLDATVWGVIAIGALARAAILALPLHYDEAFTLNEYVSRSPLFFLTRYTHANNHVFHTLLAWLVPGESIVMLRLPAFLAGVLLLYLTWRLGSELRDRATGLFACALAAGATPLVEYSAQARGYTILACCTLLLYIVTPRLESRWPIAAAAIAIGAWTIPVMVYAAVAWGAWVVATRRPVPWRTLTITALTAAAGTFVLYVPILVVTGPKSITANGNVLSVPFDVLASELPRALGDAARHASVSFTTAGLLVLAAAALVTMIRMRGREPFLIGLAAALLLTIAMRRVPFARVWIFLLPLFFIAAANGAARFVRGRWTPWIAIALAVLTSWNAVRAAGDDALRDLPAAARLVPRDGQVLVTTPYDAQLTWYLRDRRDVVVFRFDSDPAAVREAFGAPKRYLIASRRADGLDAFRRLGIRGTLVPLHLLEHAAVYQIR